MCHLDVSRKSLENVNVLSAASVCLFYATNTSLLESRLRIFLRTRRVSLRFYTSILPFQFAPDWKNSLFLLIDNNEPKAAI